MIKTVSLPDSSRSSELLLSEPPRCHCSGLSSDEREWSSLGTVQASALCPGFKLLLTGLVLYQDCSGCHPQVSQVHRMVTDSPAECLISETLNLAPALVASASVYFPDA
jgi:hypothetical protein